MRRSKESDNQGWLDRRDCIGKVLADVSMMATLAALLGNFHFRLAKRMGTVEEVAAGTELRINLHSRDGMWLHAIPRSGLHAASRVEQ